MHGSRLPGSAPPPAWSGSKENMGEYNSDDNNIVGSDKQSKISCNGTEAVLSETHGLTTHQALTCHTGHRYPTHSQVQPQRHGNGPVSVHQTVAQPCPGQDSSPSTTARKTARQAVETTAAAVHDTRPQAHRALEDIVSFTQPSQRTRTGFTPSLSFPSSYVGMPASTAGITIGPPKEEK